MVKATNVKTRVPSRKRIWVTRVFCFGLVGLFLASRSGWDTGSTLIMHAITPLAIVLATIGAIGRLWCSSYAAGNKDASLLTEGPYSITRNPLYLFSFIGGLGIAMTTETFTITIAFSLWFFWYYKKVIAGEEQHLQREFGAAFSEYVKKAPRFFPDLTLFQEPSRWTMSPAAFRRSATEVIWFVVGAIAMHGIHDMRLGYLSEGAITLY